MRSGGLTLGHEVCQNMFHLLQCRELVANAGQPVHRNSPHFSPRSAFLKPEQHADFLERKSQYLRPQNASHAPQDLLGMPPDTDGRWNGQESAALVLADGLDADTRRIREAPDGQAGRLPVIHPRRFRGIRGAPVIQGLTPYLGTESRMLPTSGNV